MLSGDVDLVLHGEHARDLLVSRDGVTSRDAVLFLYAPRCRRDVDDVVTSDIRHSVPDGPSLALMRHDYERTRDLVWFDANQGDYDLKKKYGVPDDICSCLAFLPQGTRDLYGGACQPVPGSKQQLVEFIWNAVTFQILVLNRFENAVKVSFFGKGPKLQDLFLPAGSSTVIWVFPSYSAHAYALENDDFLRGWYILDKSLKIIEIVNNGEQTWEQQWQTEQEEAVDFYRQELYNIRFSHVRRHLLILTQPSVVQNFTENGYLKTRIPQDVYTELLNIYNSENRNLRSEYYPYYYTEWNLDEIEIHQITLHEELSAILANQLKPLMEEFCRCELQQTTGPGIVTRLRRYPTGSRVRMHVDELESGHVIGSILHITRDLGGQGDWPLEVIDFGGKKQTIITTPGDMLIFESSRLPHGRPSVFQGKYFVNIFFYYNPKHDWRNGSFSNEAEEDSQSELSGNHKTKTEL